MKAAKRPPADTYKCVLAFMKELSKGHIFQFTIEDKIGNVVPVSFDDGKVSIYGREMDDEEVLGNIARWPEDFERLYYAAARTSVEESTVMRGFYIARLADLSWAKGSPAIVQIPSSAGIKTLRIEREKDGSSPVFKIDGVQVTSAEAHDLIDREYIGFLSGYKRAVKALRNGYSVPEKDESGKPAAAGETGQGITVDINNYLKPEKKTAPAKRPDILLGQDFLSRGARGYVGITGKEDKKHAD